MLITSTIVFSQKDHTDANLIGHVTAKGEHLPFATILLENTMIGTATDETGHFRIINVPTGTYIVKAQAMGYRSETKEITIERDKTIEVKFDLKEDFIGLEQVVVSASRNEQSRKDAVTVVNTISAQLFESTQSVNLGEGLNFTPGLRVENNCQNCGFTQVRMNGMEGPYSQILINSRAIFSGLAGVYGLELFPANMIERIEVVRGGGSALFGSNAIAGTINMITKDPIKSGFDINTSSSIIGVGVNEKGGMAFGNTVNFNASVVDLEAKAGATVYGFYRDKNPFDANDDGFSEASDILNTTIGTRAYHRTGKRGKITADFFNIREKRRGGDAFDMPVHAASIAEAIEHNITTGALTFDQLFVGDDKLSVFGSAQHVDRDTYYGAEMDPSAYGNTKDLSYALGTQLTIKSEKLLFAPGTFISGFEQNGSSLKDKKLGYFNYESNELMSNTLIADQLLNTTGVYAQGEWQFNALKATFGLRYDRYSVIDYEQAGSDLAGNVFSPRISLKYDMTNDITARLNYSHGFRAPQIFDEDLHIEVSGSRKVLHENDPDLKQEESKSLMASLDFDIPLGNMQNQWLIEGFYTQLNNPFVFEYGAPDENGTVIHTRKNAEAGAFVSGINFEWNLAPSPDFTMRSGFTWQLSMFEEAQEFDEQKFLRTPDTYGFLVLDYDFVKNLCLSASGNYTGSMLVPYFGDGIANPEAGELRTSSDFFDIGAKIAYDIKLNGTTLELSTGVKNILNSYQTDFDSGVNRDPSYIYGPGLPRTIYFGIKFSNLM